MVFKEQKINSYYVPIGLTCEGKETSNLINKNQKNCRKKKEKHCVYDTANY